MTANEYRILFEVIKTFWNYIVVMVTKLVNILKTIEFYGM